MNKVMTSNHGLVMMITMILIETMNIMMTTMTGHQGHVIMTKNYMMTTMTDHQGHVKMTKN